MDKDIKKFLFKLIIFVSPLVLTFLFLEYKLSLMPNKYSFEAVNLKNKSPNIKLLILGSSNAQLAINPDLLAIDSFNMANDGQSLYYDWKLLSNNISIFPHLKVVLISVSYLSLEYNLSKSPGYSLSFFYDRFLNIPPESKEPSFDLRRHSLIALYGLENSISHASNSFRPELGGVDENGYWAYFNDNNLTKDKIDDDNRRRIMYHHSIMNPQFIPENLRYLGNMIYLLKSKGVKPVIITTPVYHTYYDHINPQKYKAMQDEILQLQAKYDVEYFNYFMDKRFTVEDFGDNDHLDVEGASKFSKIINDEIIIPTTGQSTGRN